MSLDSERALAQAACYPQRCSRNMIRCSGLHYQGAIKGDKGLNGILRVELSSTIELGMGPSKDVASGSPYPHRLLGLSLRNHFAQCYKLSGDEVSGRGIGDLVIRLINLAGKLTDHDFWFVENQGIEKHHDLT